jgi:hypothetical protein
MRSEASWATGGCCARRSACSGRTVRLITDPGFTVSASFRTYRTNDAGQTEFTPIVLPQTVMEGAGNGTMVSRLLNLGEVKKSGLKQGDYVVVDDADWPRGAQGSVLGRVTSIAPRRDAPMLAEVRAEPMGDLMQLREVMVMNK